MRSGGWLAITKGRDHARRWGIIAGGVLLDRDQSRGAHPPHEPFPKPSLLHGGNQSLSRLDVVWKLECFNFTFLTCNNNPSPFFLPSSPTPFDTYQRCRRPSAMEFRHALPLTATLQLLPVAPYGLAASSLAVFLLPRTPTSYIFLFSILAFFADQALVALTPPEQSYWIMSFPTILVIILGPEFSFSCGSLIASDGLTRRRRQLRKHRGQLLHIPRTRARL